MLNKDKNTTPQTLAEASSKKQPSSTVNIAEDDTSESFMVVKADTSANTVVSTSQDNNEFPEDVKRTKKIADSTALSNETQSKKNLSLSGEDKATKTSVTKSSTTKYDVNKLPSSNTENHPLSTPITVNNSYNLKTQSMSVGDTLLNEEQLPLANPQTTKVITPEAMIAHATRASTEAIQQNTSVKAVNSTEVTVVNDIDTNTTHNTDTKIQDTQRKVLTITDIKTDTNVKNKVGATSKVSETSADKASTISKVKSNSKTNVKVNDKTRVNSKTHATIHPKADFKTKTKAKNIKASVTKVPVINKTTSNNKLTQATSLREIDLPNSKRNQIAPARAQNNQFASQPYIDMGKMQFDRRNERIIEGVISVKDSNRRKIAEERQREYQAYIDRHRVEKIKQYRSINNGNNVKSREVKKANALESTVLPINEPQSNMLNNNVSKSKVSQNNASQFSSEQPFQGEMNPIKPESEKTLADTFGYKVN